MIYLIDNYDSFSYNLYQMVGEIDPNIKVVRNDELTVEQLAEAKPSSIILSPGPGRPADAGICEDVASQIDTIPILGVCLGHQAICEAFGAKVGYAKKLMHGKSSMVKLDKSCPLFYGLEDEVQVARYHSLAVEEHTLPDCLRLTAQTKDAEVMAVQHKTRPIFGLQFHPESILTPLGSKILENFLELQK